jgi:hypothetical protein
MQRQCPWCGHCGPRYDPSDEAPPSPHSDGSACICRHITCGSRRSALRLGGRYYDRQLGRWVCLGGCGGIGSELSDSDQAWLDELEA